MTQIQIVETDWHKDAERIAPVRYTVFVEEQHVPEELEWDEADSTAIHWLAIADQQAIGTARMLQNGHIGRMAVLAEYRSRGVGSQLLTTAIQKAEQLKMDSVFLHAQVQAIAFYQEHGFEVSGNEFMDAGIPHRLMQRKL